MMRIHIIFLKFIKEKNHVIQSLCEFLKSLLHAGILYFWNFLKKCFHFCILAVSGGIHLRNIIWEDSHHLLRGDKQIDIYIRATLPICLMKFPLVPEESYEKRLDWEMGEIHLKGS